MRLHHPSDDRPASALEVSLVLTLYFIVGVFAGLLLHGCATDAPEDVAVEAPVAEELSSCSARNQLVWWALAYFGQCEQQHWLDGTLVNPNIYYCNSHHAILTVDGETKQAVGGKPGMPGTITSTWIHATIQNDNLIKYTAAGIPYNAYQRTGAVECPCAGPCKLLP